MGRGGSAARFVVAAVLAAACAAPAPTPPPTAIPATSQNPSSTASPTREPDATNSPSPGVSVAIDPALLDVLPERIGDLPLVPAPDALAEAVTDPAIVRDVEALAAAIVVDPTTDEFAYATVLRFFDGVMSDAFYRDWRDTFDVGVCERAGGVSGKAEARIGGRLVFIGSCADGAHTYHAWLGNRAILVSVSAVGEQRLGERLVEDLRD